VTSDNTTASNPALASLAGELTRHGYRTILRTPAGEPPYLYITNPHAAALTEQVYAQGGNYQYSWGQPIAACDQPATAATLARVLRTTDGH
jgi:hypothetical protein